MNEAKRIIFYIDGFNLFYGLRDAGLRKYYWLNIEFTSKIIKKLNKSKFERQKAYLRAVKTLPLVKTIFGKHKRKEYSCYFCGRKDKRPIEKMTDVNIASYMMLIKSIVIFRS